MNKVTQKQVVRVKVIIDRFEEDIAVVELDGEMYHAPRALFAECSEGDAVQITRIGRACDSTEEDENPHDIFARLRRKKRKEP